MGCFLAYCFVLLFECEPMKNRVASLVRSIKRELHPSILQTEKYRRILRVRQHKRIIQIKDYKSYNKVLKSAEANSTIARLIDSEAPTLIARFGANELRAVQEYVENRLVYKEGTVKGMEMAGFFPSEKDFLDRFAQLYMSAMKEIDMLGVWYLEKEAYCVKQFCPNAYLCELEDLEPYFHKSPWSAKLEHKKVLVAHPFAESIKENYQNKRTLLFEDPNLLPKFDLQTFKTVHYWQGSGFEVPFKDWFEAYEFMCDQISKIDFDVAIVGCAAYGLPLGGFIKKELNKSVVHLGGATQILFGIKGKRWDNYPFFKDQLYNSHWTRVKESETVGNYKMLEGGAYW